MSGRLASKAAGKAASKAGSKSRGRPSKAKPMPVIENAPKHLVLGLYKQLMRESRKLKLTDPSFFRNRIRQEFFKRKNAKDNNLYYIRGKWMLENNMGGLL